MNSKDKRGREDAYREPNAVCKTCGRPTSGRARTPTSKDYGGYGDFHYDCARVKGRLLTVGDGEGAKA